MTHAGRRFGLARLRGCTEHAPIRASRAGNVYGDYKFQLSATMDATLRAEYQYRSSSLRQFDTTMLVTYPDGSSAHVDNMAQVQDSYAIVNVNLTVFRGDWQYRLYINNLLDEAPYLDFSRAGGAVSDNATAADDWCRSEGELLKSALQETDLCGRVYRPHSEHPNHGVGL